jgi:murein DD-endopeptidase / murein LD-carboxypeptidase
VKVIFEKVKFIILLVVVCELLNTYCSKHIYSEHASQQMESQVENKKKEKIKSQYPEKAIIVSDANQEDKKLRNFMNAGIQKKLSTGNTTAEEIINTAQKYLGVPHCMGGTTMKCLDCSGLLVIAFAKYGIHLPHNSEEQARYGKIIKQTDELRKGDLVFFTRSYKTHYFITHSGIYLGDNKFIHTSSKNGVTITSLSDTYWKEKFVFGTRILK